MTRENWACYPQVTQGVNKICSQFVLCRSEKNKKNTGLYFILASPISIFDMLLRPAFIFISQYYQINKIRTVDVHVRGVCSSSNGHFNQTENDINSTINQQIRHQKEANPMSSVASQGQRESVSIGTGITDLGGIGKTNSKQVYYIWRAIFTASTKRTQKVLYLTI